MGEYRVRVVNLKYVVDNNIAVGVDRPSNVESLLLTARKSNTLDDTP